MKDVPDTTLQGDREHACPFTAVGLQGFEQDDIVGRSGAADPLPQERDRQNQRRQRENHHPTRLPAPRRCCRMQGGRTGCREVEKVPHAVDGAQPAGFLPKRLAQRHDMHRQGVLFDGRIGPDALQQFLLSENLAVGFGQMRKNAQRPPAQPDARTTGQQLPVRLQRHRADRNLVQALVDLPAASSANSMPRSIHDERNCGLLITIP